MGPAQHDALVILALPVEVVINLFRHRLVDPGDGFEIGQAGGGDAAGRAEVQQQRAFTLPPDSGNLVQRRTGDVGGTLGAMVLCP